MVAVYEFVNRHFWFFLGLTIFIIKLVLAYKRQKATELDSESEPIMKDGAPEKKDVFKDVECTSEKMNLSSYYIAAIPLKYLNVYAKICKMTVLDSADECMNNCFLVMIPNQKWAVFASDNHEILALSDKYLAAISKFSGAVIVHFSSSVSMASGLQKFENGESKYWITFDGQDLKVSDGLDQEDEQFIHKNGIMKDSEFDVSLKLFEKHIGVTLDNIQISKRFKVASSL